MRRRGYMGGDAMSGIWAQPLAAQLALASLIMLVLVWMIIWAIRRFGSTQEATPRWRQVRLGVNNQAIIDAHRRLIVVRRDDVEHVLLIGGGNNDLIVERTIVRDWPLERSDGDRLLQIESTRQAIRSAHLTVEDTVDFPLQPDAEPSTRSLRDIL